MTQPDPRLLWMGRTPRQIELHQRAFREGCADGARMARQAATAGAGARSHAMQVTQESLCGGALHIVALARGRELAWAAGLRRSRERLQRDTYAATYAKAAWGEFINWSMTPEATRLQGYAERMRAAIEYGLATDAASLGPWLS